MTLKKLLTLTFVGIYASVTCIHAQLREVITLDTGWKFMKGNQENAASVNFNDTQWKTVTVPHDWAIYGPFDKTVDMQKVAIEQNGEKVATEKTGRTGALPHVGQAWYRKEFSVPEYRKGKKVLLTFDGAMSEPKVYLNGEKIGEWNYGYSYFYFDITNHIKEGQTNTLAVQLTTHENSSRWY